MRTKRGALAGKLPSMGGKRPKHIIGRRPPLATETVMNALETIGIDYVEARIILNKLARATGEPVPEGYEYLRDEKDDTWLELEDILKDSAVAPQDGRPRSAPPRFSA